MTSAVLGEEQAVAASEQFTASSLESIDSLPQEMKLLDCRGFCELDRP